jgi:hypothetical protein
VNAACGGALKHKIGGIERKRADSPVMMPAMSVCSYAGVVNCRSALECIAFALDRTRASV